MCSIRLPVYSHFEYLFKSVTRKENVTKSHEVPIVKFYYFSYVNFLPFVGCASVLHGNIRWHHTPLLHFVKLNKELIPSLQSDCEK